MHGSYIQTKLGLFKWTQTNWQNMDLRLLWVVLAWIPTLLTYQSVTVMNQHRKSCYCLRCHANPHCITYFLMKHDFLLLISFCFLAEEKEGKTRGRRVSRSCEGGVFAVSCGSTLPLLCLVAWQRQRIPGDWKIFSLASTRWRLVFFLFFKHSILGQLMYFWDTVPKNVNPKIQPT